MRCNNTGDLKIGLSKHEIPFFSTSIYVGCHHMQLKDMLKIGLKTISGRTQSDMLS